MEVRRAAELDPEWKPVRRGWCLRGREFRQELLTEIRGRIEPHHGGGERRETEAVNRPGIGAASQKRCAETRDGPAAASGNNDDLALD